jgi:hypothetical protein
MSWDLWIDAQIRKKDQDHVLVWWFEDDKSAVEMGSVWNLYLWGLFPYPGTHSLTHFQEDSTVGHILSRDCLVNLIYSFVSQANSLPHKILWHREWPCVMQCKSTLISFPRYSDCFMIHDWRSISSLSWCLSRHFLSIGDEMRKGTNSVYGGHDRTRHCISYGPPRVMVNTRMSEKYVNCSEKNISYFRRGLENFPPFPLFLKFDRDSRSASCFWNNKEIVEKWTKFQFWKRQDLKLNSYLWLDTVLDCWRSSVLPLNRLHMFVVQCQSSPMR